MAGDAEDGRIFSPSRRASPKQGKRIPSSSLSKRLGRHSGKNAFLLNESLGTFLPPDGADIKRFLGKIEKTPEGCWFWMGATDKKGYGQFKLGRSSPLYANQCVATHRFAFWMANGFLTAGLQVGHKCAHPGCVNPKHLEEQTPSENWQEEFARVGLRGAAQQAHARKVAVLAEVEEPF